MDAIIRKPYEKTERHFVKFNKPSRTKQAHKDECDINIILKKYIKNGILTHVAAYGGTYLDLPNEVDYQSCLNFVIRAQSAFEQLPAHVRNRFNNDPAQFLKFAENAENREEMVKMGLMKPPPEPEAPAEAPSSVETTETPADG